MRALTLLLLLMPALQAAHAANTITFDVAALPALQRYAGLLDQPGYLAVALENNDLSPSQSSKLKVLEDGRAAEIRNAVLRFTGKKGQVFTYEASYRLGIGDTSISFPLAVDLSELGSGKARVSLSPPLASLIPADLIERIRLKMGLVANSQAQHHMLEYFDRVSRGGDLPRAILVEAYNRSAAAVVGKGDVGDALPLSDQWLLIITLAIWVVGLPVLVVVQQVRRIRRKTA